MNEVDLPFTFFSLLLTIFGALLLKSAVAKVSIVLRSITWPKVELDYVSVNVRHKESTHVVSDAAGDQHRYDSVVSGPFYDRGVTREYYPVLSYGFTVNGEQFRGSNVDAWNAGGYAAGRRDVVEETQQAWVRSKPTVAYHPRDPRLHWLGWTQFPIALTVVQLAAGLFLTVALTIVLDDLCTLAGVEVPTFGEAKRSVFLFIPPGLALLYLLFGRPKPRQPV